MRRIAHPARMRTLPPLLGRASAASPRGSAPVSALHTSPSSSAQLPYRLPSAALPPPQPSASDPPLPSPKRSDMRRLPRTALQGRRIPSVLRSDEAPRVKPEDLEPPESALAALLSRLGLDAADRRLRREAVACLTHPSWVDKQKRRIAAGRVAGKAVEGRAVGEQGMLEQPQAEEQGSSLLVPADPASYAVSSVDADADPDADNDAPTSLIDPSPAAPRPPAEFHDNALLASLGNSLLALFASEHLAATYPFLPTDLLQAAVTAHVGSEALASVGRELGVSVHGGGNQTGVGLGRGQESQGLGMRFDRAILTVRKEKAGVRTVEKSAEEEEEGEAGGSGVEAVLKRWDDKAAARAAKREGRAPGSPEEAGAAGGEGDGAAQVEAAAEEAAEAAVEGEAEGATEDGSAQERGPGKTSRAGVSKGKGGARFVPFPAVVASAVRSMVGLVYQEKVRLPPIPPSSQPRGLLWRPPPTRTNGRAPLTDVGHPFHAPVCACALSLAAPGPLGLV